jgi:hypothetical protein
MKKNKKGAVGNTEEKGKRMQENDRNWAFKLG